MAGAALFAVPVGVAALIGFGTSLSGVAGGLSAVTSGPDDAVPAAQTTPTKLNHAVVALASKSTGSGPGAGGGDGTNDLGGSPTGGANGGGSGGGSDGGPGGAGGETSLPNPPDVQLPSGGGGGGGGGGAAGDTLNNTVDGVKDVLGGVNSNVRGLLGK